MDTETSLGFDAGFCGEVRQLLERGDEFRAAIRITRVIDCIYSYINVETAQYLGPGQRQGEKNCIASRNIGNGNIRAHRFERAVMRDGKVRCQGRAAEGTQI